MLRCAEQRRKGAQEFPVDMRAEDPTDPTTPLDATFRGPNGAAPPADASIYMRGRQLDALTGTGGGGGSHLDAGDTIFFSSTLDAAGHDPDPADPQGTRNTRLFYFEVDSEASRTTNWSRPSGSLIGVRGSTGPIYGESLAVEQLLGAKGRISIRIDLPKEGKVFHFQRLGGKAPLECEASEEDGAFLEGLLAVACALAAAFILRARRA